jgi:beta-glucosidase
MIQFPHNFFWGAATSAYQVEGDNLNCDWWEWEKRVGLQEVSGQACRHYHLYKQDFALAQSLNHNAHRLSIEWSHIEPEEGKFSQQEIDHYRDVILSLKELNIEPIVTLHHFTNPLWFAKLGGWLNKNAPRYFLRYTERIVEALADKVNYWVTINEPMVYVYHAYILGAWPPQKRSFFKAKKVTHNLATAHIRAYRLIRSIYQKRNLSFPSISIAQNLQAFISCSPTFPAKGGIPKLDLKSLFIREKNKFAAYLRDRLFNFDLINKLIRYRALDFIGVNYYTRSLIDVEGWGMKNLLLDTCKKNHSVLAKNSMGWDIYPEGLYLLLLKLKKYRLPLFILENGICTEDDNARWDFISAHLKHMHRAMTEGVKVLGYIYWSLLDNYEWDKGFGPRFGLIEVDYSNYKRTIRESAKKFSLVCNTGRLD